MNIKNDKVRKTRFGYYELAVKPTAQELETYYASKYYQENEKVYKRSYTDEEIVYINNKILQKYLILAEKINSSEKTRPSLLDIGAGEGWTIKFFKDKKWDVVGIDYSEFGCRTHNADLLNDFYICPIDEGIRLLIDQEKKFNVIWIGNVLEHILEPYLILEEANKLIKEKGILVAQVPNDFSIIQDRLLKEGYITEQFWVVAPDHINYFNKESLINLCHETGWEAIDCISDYPIDFCLFNENTNYYKDKHTGQSCHKQRLEIENFLHSISPQKTNQLYRALADMGLGRNITIFFAKRS